MSRVILVTGASRGIGYYTAKKFLSCGDRVILTGRDEQRLRTACESLALPETACVVWDVSKTEQAREKIALAEDIYGGIDVFCNNAGVLTDVDWSNSFFDVTAADWDKTIDINLKGLFFACQAEADYFITGNRSGHIVNLCSELSFRGVYAPYGISKWGARGLTVGLGKLLAPHGIIVNGVAPGSTSTTMVRQQEGAIVEMGTPRGVMATPEEIAELIYFMAGAHNLVGEVVVSDGGSRLV